MDNVFSKIEQYYNYDEFIDLVDQLVVNESTTGPDQTEALVDFTKLNAQRMKRVSKTTKVEDSLIAKLKKQPKQIWWVITEAWCGDSAQNLPILAKLAAASEGTVELRIILRDENLEVIDKYLTNGGRSIPKLIAQQDGNDKFTWGPRPAKAQELVLDWKANPNDKSFEEFEKELHTWYAKDRGAATLSEFQNIIT